MGLFGGSRDDTIGPGDAAYDKLVNVYKGSLNRNQVNETPEIEQDDPGDGAFYGDIAAVFDRMKEEESPQTNPNTKQCEILLKNALEQHGIMGVLVSLATILSETSNTCPHRSWLSSNLNVLTNRTAEHNQLSEFPFGQ